jgi:hypothetical protein
MKEDETINEIETNEEDETINETELLVEINNKRNRLSKCSCCDKTDNKFKIFCKICNCKIHEHKCSCNGFCLPCNVINLQEMEINQ